MPIQFRIHTKEISGDTRTSDEIAADLADKIMAVFGNDETANTPTLTMDVGVVTQTSYISDFGVREGDEEYRWIINYEFLIDMPVKVGV